MFRRLRESRSLLMGLAIAGVALYHTSMVMGNHPWLQLIHDSLYGGVDVFLFLSGLGACHSISARGGKGYLRQRVRRLLPGLYPILLPWCLVMLLLGAMDWGDILGSVTLLGWWVGRYNQLNWYFSGVWMFFLLAVPMWALFRRSRRPLLLYLGVVALTLVPQWLLSPQQWSMLLARIPIFLLGMLLGLLELRGFPREGLLRGILLALLPVGIGLIVAVQRGWHWEYGYSLGLWWYPYLLAVPGAAILIAHGAFYLRAWAWGRALIRPLEAMGRASSEILMVHMAIYKIIWHCWSLSNRQWLVVFLLCLGLGVGYRKVVERFLPT